MPLIEAARAGKRRGGKTVLSAAFYRHCQGQPADDVTPGRSRRIYTCAIGWMLMCQGVQDRADESPIQARLAERLAAI
jgi:hypothetical protein